MEQMRVRLKSWSISSNITQKDLLETQLADEYSLAKTNMEREKVTSFLTAFLLTSFVKPTHYSFGERTRPSLLEVKTQGPSAESPHNTADGRDPALPEVP